VLLGLALLGPFVVFAQNKPNASVKDTSKQEEIKKPAARSVLNIPHIDRAPTLDDFKELAPSSPLALTMSHANEFKQHNPTDGAAATQRTDAYLGYDQSNIYVVFLCHDEHADQIRAQMTKRENAFADDYVEITLDTFKDQRRGYVFWSNPLGIQAEGLWTEDNGDDWSWDTVWNTTSRRTAHGYMVIMSIPFRSLRFSHAEMQDWGFILHRVIPRNNEDDFWPFVSAKLNGRMNQEAELTGLEKISPSRNFEIDPYGIWRADRTLNSIDTPPHFEGEDLGGRVGADAKLVIKDSLVLDLTIKPDFSQVESDQPQITINQRFPVFFPEKRPFFLENNTFFNTSFNLLYTRNIIDPDWGARLTGKIGKWSLGFILADDKSPGESVANNDPNFGKKATFAIARVNYDLFKQSTIGFIYTDREFAGSWNRIGGIDGNFKWHKNYFANFQILATSTKDIFGNYFAGPAGEFSLGYSGRKFNMNTYYQDDSNGYQTLVGFYSRPGYRQFSNFLNYRWRPEKKWLISFGPNIFQQLDWDHTGLRLDYINNVNFQAEMKKNTFFGVFYNAARSRLRPQDYSTLTTNIDLANGGRGFFFQSDIFKFLSVNAQTVWGNTPNVIPTTGPPRGSFERNFNGGFTLKPVTRMQITTTYLLDNWVDETTRKSEYTTHIIRSKWYYQINREMSLRFIGQYNANLSHPELVALDTSKEFNYDFLFTYFIHPGTALYVGYNTDLDTLNPMLIQGPNGLVQRSNQYINDGRQVFVKLSYLFRF